MQHILHWVNITVLLKNVLKKSPKIRKNSTDYEAFVRTAICAEIREKKLYLFLPPIQSAEAFLDLIASIETTAAQLNMPVMIEGYEAPSDLRIEKMRVTPDPGVIEVNIHPTSVGKSSMMSSERCMKQAHYSRLGTEKFMQDGKHTGTGGGNHVTIGGLTPSDSPLLAKS